MKLDEYTLAAYLAGDTSDAHRKTVAAALVQDREARETLHLACEALAAAMDHGSVRDYLADRASRPPARPGIPATDRRSLGIKRGSA